MDVDMIADEAARRAALAAECEVLADQCDDLAAEVVDAGMPWTAQGVCQAAADLYDTAAALASGKRVE